ncbi:hypothetical protein [Halobacteriovorax sp. ZH1_bin.1]|uniref:hypothetical protein n=1 Tax=Halobacteriovorax sp. ZH1_bin.1 TaxID=3157723 RepID=UPI003717F505
MKTKFREGLFEEVIESLKRPHPFAFERVGYFLGEIKEGVLLLDEWMEFEDFLYEENEEVGARIGGEGMTMLMEKAFSSKKSFFHTHLHDFQDEPYFSSVDMRSLLEVTPSLFDFTETCPHGAILIGRKKSRLVWWDQKQCLSKNEQLINYGLGPRRNYEE